jgi:hypothetical protein
MREDLGLAWESIFFGFLLTALAQKHECERLHMSECAKDRSWPNPVVHPNIRKQGLAVRFILKSRR